ncbi:tumor necrosis factor ligand superfamily member 12 [Paroedura picta]|uniref:tumor necrosis factor ligand superfamily member 12 n=1 Tax=Paroedura picta TaxID=143630 RepID=UPI0040562225
MFSILCGHGRLQSASWPALAPTPPPGILVLFARLADRKGRGIAVLRLPASRRAGALFWPPKLDSTCAGRAGAPRLPDAREGSSAPAGVSRPAPGSRGGHGGGAGAPAGQADTCRARSKTEPPPFPAAAAGWAGGRPRRAPPPPPPPAAAAAFPARLLRLRRRRRLLSRVRPPGPAMGRRRRPRAPPSRLPLLALALASASALLLASLSLLLAAWPRPADAARTQEILSADDTEAIDPVVLSTSWNSQGKLLHHFAQQGALRQRRQAAGRGKRRSSRASTVLAAHYEVQSTEGRGGSQADGSGTICGWAEAKLNTSSPLRYNSSRGEFTVLKKGLYYLYCQVHFNEDKTNYMKLDVVLGGQLALRCVEEFRPTSSGPQKAELRVCHVSGLVLLRPHETIRLKTIPNVQLKADRYLTYFGLFQVHSVPGPGTRGSHVPSMPLGILWTLRGFITSSSVVHSSVQPGKRSGSCTRIPLIESHGEPLDPSVSCQPKGHKARVSPKVWTVPPSGHVSFVDSIVFQVLLASFLRWALQRCELLRLMLFCHTSCSLALPGRPWGTRARSGCSGDSEGPPFWHRARWKGPGLSWAGGTERDGQSGQGGEGSSAQASLGQKRLLESTYPAFEICRPGRNLCGRVCLAFGLGGGDRKGVSEKEFRGAQNANSSCHSPRTKGQSWAEAGAPPLPLSAGGPLGGWGCPGGGGSRLPALHPLPLPAPGGPARGALPAETRAAGSEAPRRRTAQDPPGKQSVLHLVPVRQSSSGDGDTTEIWWATFLHQGRALELSGQDVIVKHTGLYFVYSQVLFHDHTFTMGQELRRLGPEGQAETLFRCIQSMPAKLELAYNSCYSGGIFHLQKGDRVNLRVPRFNASLILSPHGTFLGLLRL